MGQVTRSTKPNGTTDWVDGDTLGETPLNGDVNPIVNEINGNLENVNVKSDADIALTKLGDASSSDATSRAHATPTGSASPSKATTAEGEIQRLRNRIMALGVGVSALRNDGTASADEASWQDPPRIGPNLARNASFEAYNGAANSAPDGWTLIDATGTNITVAQVETDVDQGEGKAIRITHSGDSEDEGISQTFSGLKAGTRYVVGCSVEVTSGTFHLKTTGADGSDYGNLDLTSTAADFEVVSGVIVTDSSATDIVVQLVSEGGAADDFRCDHFFFYELGEDPVASSGATVYVTSTDTGASHYSAATWTKADNTAGTADLEAAVTVPGPGFEIIVDAWITATSTTGASNTQLVARIEQDDGSSTTTSESFYASIEALAFSATASPIFVNTAPTPGLTYTYKVEGNPANQALTAVNAGIRVQLRRAN